MDGLVSQQGQRYYFDALIIGSGIAALTYALRLSYEKPMIKIALLSKTDLSESNSNYAQGGIAIAEINKQSHHQDTIDAGAGLCIDETVEAIINGGQQALDYLIGEGVDFAKQADGKYDLAQEGGHSERRIFHQSDQTGRAITQCLLNKVIAANNITCLANHTAVNLITDNHLPQPGVFPEVLGAYVLDESLGLIHTMLAKVTVLATGGAGKVYRYTTNSAVATGDGIAMAYRAGARVSNMEFYQFHPTLFYHPKLNNLLLTEALRGEGAYLRSPVTGQRFMEKYAPRQMELATRDVVARAIFTEIESSGAAYVNLDLRHLEASFLQQRFPFICQSLNNHGYDLAKDLIPVVPAAHYLCGGILTDISGRTDLKRLIAIGETACSGLHGANRLASNSLLEAVVMGMNAAQGSLPWLDKELPKVDTICDWNSQGVTDLRRASQINAHWRGLRGEMTSYAGIIRTEAGLKDLSRLINLRSTMIEGYYRKHIITRDLVELRNIVLVAKLIVKAARLRKESRGGHYREDFPEALKFKKSSIQQHQVEEG